MFVNPLTNHLQHRPHIVLYIMVPKSQKSDSKPLQNILSCSILVGLEIMTPTIDFDGQA